MRHRTLHMPLAAAIVLLTLFATASSASAELSFGPPGSGAGQTSDPKGIAVDTSVAEPQSGHVYVADSGNSRIDVFDSSGAFLFAFGWKVNAATPEEKLQTCTTATGCQKGTAGSGAGQLSGLEGIAVDPSSHDVYVVEEANHRIEKFDSAGSFLLMFGREVNSGSSGKANLCTNAGAPTDVCKAGAQGFGAGQFNSIGGIAVGSTGAIYVADSENLGTCPIPGSGGSEFAKQVQKFNLLGEPIEAVKAVGTPCGRVRGFALDPGGDFYLANTGGTGGVRKYDPAGNPIAGWGESGKVNPSFNISAIALDAAGDLFVGDLFEGATAEILEYDPTGAKLRAFYGSLKGPAAGLAVHHTANGDLFATEAGGVLQIALPPPGPLVQAGSTEATETGNSKATLKARVNPEGKATEFAFQYVDDATFLADVGAEGPGHGFDHAQTSGYEAIPGPGGSGFGLQSVARKLPPASLAPETKYHFRLIAKNADAPAGNVGDEGAPFTTLGPPEVLDAWATEVGSDSARLHAEVDPLELATTGYFQYVDDATYEADVEALGPGHGFDHAQSSPDVPGGSAPLDFGSGEGGVARSAVAYPLSPNTTYRYRLIAEDPFAPVVGPERTLRTFALSGASDTACPNQAFRIGASARLPDCRAYEMVSPLDKNNGDILTLFNLTGYPTNLDQSSLEGSAFTYSSYRAFADPESAPYTNQYIATREEGKGWSSESINPPHGRTFELENQYKAFTADLSSAWLLQGAPALDPCVSSGADLYRREAVSGAYEALSCGQQHPGGPFKPELEGFSADGSKSVFRVEEALTADASSATTGIQPRLIYQVYEASGPGDLHLISVLPSGEASDKDSSAGTALETNITNQDRFNSLAHAVSEDGSRVFWSAGIGDSGPLYLRENATAEQSASGACDEAGRACTIEVSAGEPAYFQAADPQGTKALFTLSAGSLKGNLYEFDVAEESRRLIAAGVLGSILGASDDLSRVYFASEEATGPEQAEGAVKGKPNIYLDEEGATRFIGTLSGADFSDQYALYGTPTEKSPIFRTARVSADGSSLVFMSAGRALSEAVAGYDNTDEKSGEADTEVYLYDAGAEGGAGRLRCVSCNPSGARPLGREIGEGINGKVGPWAAATVPRFETQLHQPRYLSDDGRRVFFNSFEPLVLSDTNGKGDVYQWEAPGTGRCSADSPTYIPASAGCLSLLSSGKSSGDSEFLDASPSGADAFFTTAESLLPQDYGLIDVYDARVSGGFPAPPAPPPACEGDACQSPVAPPNDPTPASASFRGAPNPLPHRQASRHRQKRAHHKHRREHRHHRRAAR